MDGVALRAMGGEGKNATTSFLAGPSVTQTLFRHSLYPEYEPRRVLEKAQLVLKYTTLQKLTLDKL